MKTQLLNQVEAALVINQMAALGQRFELPKGLKLQPYDRKYALNWHTTHLRCNYFTSDTSLRISGRFDNQNHRCFTGEIRFFLKESEYSKGRFKAMLFARIGLGYGFKSTNLLENQNDSIDSPFIYGDSVDEVIKIAQYRMAAAIERAEQTDCSEWEKVYQKDREARKTTA